MPNSHLLTWKKLLPTTSLLMFLSLCIVLGGSGVDGLFWHGLLQVAAATGLAILSLSWPKNLKLGAAKLPILILSSFGFIAALQCIELPVALWSAIPGRDSVALGFVELGISNPAMPFSLDVESTMATVPYLLIPLFVLTLGIRVGSARLSNLASWFVTLMASAIVLLGLLQVLVAPDFDLYLYEFSNRGFPVGPFANANHFACFLLMSIPFAIHLIQKYTAVSLNSDASIALSVFLIAVLLLLLIGIVAAGSVAVYLMTVPVLIIASVVTWSAKITKRGRRWSIAVIGVSMIVSCALVLSSPIIGELGVTILEDGPLSRYRIWDITLDGTMTYWPMGSGIGTYHSVIPLFEDRAAVTSTYVARAHNDYLQLVMETGLVGVVGL